MLEANFGSFDISVADIMWFLEDNLISQIVT